MKFILACGGSGGHIYPALAVARLLRDEGHDVLFVGAPHGLEGKLIPHAGFPIEFVDIQSLSHSFKPKAIARNIKVAWKMLRASGVARKIVRNFAPDAALGTGGYASYPPLAAAQKLDVPVLVHESNAVPGLTTSMLAKKATKILVGMEACRGAYPQKDCVEVVGTPVRTEFFNQNRTVARTALRLDNRPLVVSFFGSQGARDMNVMMADVMRRTGEHGKWQMIHVTGNKAYDDFKAKTGAFPPHVRVEPYLHNMPEVMAAADLIICRSGASSLAELAAARCPSILVPSKNVTNDHQTANAKAFQAAGCCVMYPESELSGEILDKNIETLLQNVAKLDTIRVALAQAAVPDAAERIKALLTNR